METPSTKSLIRKRIFLSIIAILAGFRVITAILGLRFNSIYTEELYWGMVSLVAVIWLISAQRKVKVVAQLILAFTVFYSFLFVACLYFTWLFVGKVEKVKPEKFGGTDQEVWLEFHQGIWEEEGCEKLCVGKSYFSDWMHKEDTCLELTFTENADPWLGAESFKIPDSVDVRNCIFWQQKQVLFDMKNKTCYKLEPKEEIALSETP